MFHKLPGESKVWGKRRENCHYLGTTILKDNIREYLPIFEAEKDFLNRTQETLTIKEN